GARLSLTLAAAIAAALLPLGFPASVRAAAVPAGQQPGTLVTAAGGPGQGIPKTVGQYPYGVAVRGTKVYTADRGGPRWTFSDVHVLDTTSGLQSVFAGTASSGYSGDGGPATAAQLNGPTDMAFDAAGDVFIADAGNNVIRKVDTSGTISTVAGTGQAGFSGDGGPATSATLKD